MEQKRIAIKDLVQNTGQIEGLPANPRQWTREELDRLKASIAETPELLEARGIIVYPYNHLYIAMGGNMRLAALTEMGEKDAPCIVLPAGTTIDKLKEIVIKDNGAFGKHDWDALANEWSDLPLTDWGIPVWENEEEKTEGIAAHEDGFDEEKDAVETRCEVGDIWQLGEHRLMCGDSTDIICVEKLMQEEKADMVFTDPPYNVAYSEKNEFLNRSGKANSVTTPIENDKNTSDDEAGEKVWRPAFFNMLQVADDACSIYVTMPQGGTHMMMMMMMHEAGWQVKHELIWNKNNHVLGRTDYYYKHEPICFGWNKKHHFYGKGEFDKSVWDIPKPTNSDLHPTMKPIELIANALLNSSKEQDIVLDVFGGSGSTLIACEQLNRKCRMMEIDPHYCDVIIARWEKETGRKAVKFLP